jgi:hypothetical protein
MPLRDHFRPPVNTRHRWDAVHGQWPAEMVRELFHLLPPRYQAEPKIHLGSSFEADISTYEDERSGRGADTGVGVATLAAPAPTLTVEADLSEFDQYEVRIYDEELGRRLVAAIEIVSPSNKDRPKARETFVGKVTTLLQQDVCVTIVDLVSILHTNLYVELLEHLDRTDPNLGPTPPDVYTATLRGRKRAKGRDLLDTWFYPMTVGQPLPTVPVWLAPDFRILFPLETSYEETCRLLRIA